MPLLTTRPASATHAARALTSARAVALVEAPSASRRLPLEPVLVAAGARASAAAAESSAVRTRQGDTRAQKQIEALQLQLRLSKLQLALKLHERRQTVAEGACLASPRAASPARPLPVSAPATLRRRHSPAEEDTHSLSHQARSRLLDAMHARGRAATARRHAKVTEPHSSDETAMGACEDSSLSQASTCASGAVSPVVHPEPLPEQGFFKSLAQSIRAKNEKARKACSNAVLPDAYAASSQQRTPRGGNPCTPRCPSCTDAHELCRPTAHASSTASIYSTVSSSRSTSAGGEGCEGAEQDSARFELSEDHSYYISGLVGDAISARIARKFKLLELMFERAEKSANSCK